VDSSRLATSRRYTLARITGARTGAFKVGALPDSRWHVTYGSDGTVNLVFTDGLRLLLR